LGSSWGNYTILSCGCGSLPSAIRDDFVVLSQSERTWKETGQVVGNGCNGSKDADDHRIEAAAIVPLSCCWLKKCSTAQALISTYPLPIGPPKNNFYVYSNTYTRSCKSTCIHTYTYVWPCVKLLFTMCYSVARLWLFIHIHIYKCLCCSFCGALLIFNLFLCHLGHILIK
jgi:hypothetical protein